MDTQRSTHEVNQPPLHRRIAESLTNQVQTGKLKPGDNLPSERQIARQFSASRATVRTALQRLEQAGLITRRERRSAVVKIRRDIIPHLRLAASQPRLIDLMRRLANQQLLPPRCQLWLTDLQGPHGVRQLVNQPVLGADALICEIEYASFFAPTPQAHPFTDAVALPFHSFCRRGDLGLFTPVGLSPFVLYYNKQILDRASVPHPATGWTWDQLQDAAKRTTRNHTFGLQIRPTFSHLSAIAASLGGALCRNDGHAAVDSEPFQATLRLIHNLLHVDRVTPLLAKSDPVNLFADGRCAIAIDPFHSLGHYQSKLGDRLAVAPMPRAATGRPALAGFAIAVLGEPVDPQATNDLVRSMLAPGIQQAIVRLHGGLPVRQDLHSPDALRELGLPQHLASLFLNELDACRPVPFPADPAYKRNLELLFLELWLAIDSLDGIRHRLHSLA